ncbi:MAG: pilus assembly protein [Paenibacillaceae bacterium]|uniref:Pilus assembly protein n=1 Tax=Paenibacillus mellifer TaxID=2937794 RepID=A0A9X1XY36_9BACL|nr:pilus assembly protein [Paenibacillus mellifer]MBW4839761.1 pilus assembly protein [Paenibacillaceae bacterium]MCK8485858.1 pilus assembly protein [Paenibacillus mellifer]
MLPNKRTFRIERSRSCRFREKRSEGSITLEAALIAPVFVMVVFWFVFLVHMTLLSGQLHTAVSNAVKQVSAHIYPVAIAAEDSGNKGTVSGNGPFSWRMPSLSLEEWAGQYAAKLPAPLSTWVTDAARKGDEPLQELKANAAEAVLDPLVKPILRPFLQGTLLEEDRLHVSRVTVPDLKTGKQPYFGLEVSYELPLKVPFTGWRMVLQTRAEERLWIGDTGEVDSGAGSGEGQTGEAAVVIAKPDPAYAGHRATIIAQVAPGASASLTVYYKSGASQAKYLGEAIADDQGRMTWTWLVGGNTTPGTWSFVIETGEGLRTTAQFEVASPHSK